MRRFQMKRLPKHDMGWSMECRTDKVGNNSLHAHQRRNIRDMMYDPESIDTPPVDETMCRGRSRLESTSCCVAVSAAGENFCGWVRTSESNLNTVATL
eukprot:537844-Hanusia_phi.AAC.1